MTFKLSEIAGIGNRPREQPPALPPKAAQPVCARTGKVQHTRASADETIRQLRVNGDPQGERLDKYRCYSCLQWHVGHKGW